MNKVAETISAIDELRAKVNATDLSVGNKLFLIEQCQVLSSQPVVQAFIADIKNYTKQKGRLNNVKRHINEGIDNFVFSVFSAPYFSDLGLDGFYYEKIKISDSLQNQLSSPALPVNIIKASQGFHSKPVVALFPENHIDRIQLPEDKIFYFIDKFVARFYNITHKLLAIINNNQFCLLRHANIKEIEAASAHWVFAHEFFHRQGSMPIPEFLDIKTNKALAGLEELRVDLLSILYFLNNPNLFSSTTFIVEFILAERLLRYAVEGIPHPTYDAIASQVLFNYLVENKAITVKNKIITLNANLYATIQAFSNEITTIESAIVKENRLVVKQLLLNFVQRYLKYDAAKNVYLHSNYFAWVKTHFKV